MKVVDDNTTKAIIKALRETLVEVRANLLEVSNRKYRKLNSRQRKKIIGSRREIALSKLQMGFDKLKEENEKAVEDMRNRKVLDVFTVNLDVPGDPEERSFEVTTRFPDLKE